MKYIVETVGFAETNNYKITYNHNWTLSDFAAFSSALTSGCIKENIVGSFLNVHEWKEILINNHNPGRTVELHKSMFVIVKIDS